MEISLYLLENLFFPLLVALIILYIEKYIDNDSENMQKKTAAATAVFFDPHGESHSIFLGLIQELF